MVGHLLCYLYQQDQHFLHIFVINLYVKIYKNH